MRRRHELLHSADMGRPVHLWCFGHWGMPVLAFPTAAGFAHEWDRQGMVEALAELIDGARIKLYCPESNVAEAWTRRDSDPAWRISRHQAYERFVINVLVPWIRTDCHSPSIRIATAGASLGAFYAANFALKFPELFHWALCMSGRYEMSHFTSGLVSSDVYFNNPMAYVANLEGEHLRRVRDNTHLVLVCGQGPWEEGCIEETHALADLLARKGISHERDIWGHDVSHDWPWWRRQALYHLRRRFG
ncbi:MAG: esterase [Acidobacteria bacterium]|nr:MAG: esterase [Acidobacteriota bacterium]